MNLPEPNAAPTSCPANRCIVSGSSVLVTMSSTSKFPAPGSGGGSTGIAWTPATPITRPNASPWMSFVLRSRSSHLVVWMPPKPVDGVMMTRQTKFVSSIAARFVVTSVADRTVAFSVESGAALRMKNTPPSSSVGASSFPLNM